jgi:hypothetical protein
VGLPFSTAALGCTGKAESVAMQVMREPTIGVGASGYLYRCSNSPVALEMLKSKKNLGELPESAASGIARIERRIREGGEERK